MTNCRLFRQPTGMSLVELLVVISIMSILLVLAASSFRNIAHSAEMTNSAQALGDAMNLGRQLATARNEYAQIRFYSPASTTDPRNGHFTIVGVYRADSPFYTNDYTQLFSSGRIRQEGSLIKLPDSCAIISNAAYSPLVSLLASDAKRSGIQQFPDGSTHGWVGFYFKPDGSTDIPATSTTNVISVCGFQEYNGRGQKLPPNYAILNLDRIDGRVQVVRP